MKTQVNIHMDDDLKTSLEELARKDGRSLNNLINKVLTVYANENKPMSKEVRAFLYTAFGKEKEKLHIGLSFLIEGKTVGG